MLTTPTYQDPLHRFAVVRWLSAWLPRWPIAMAATLAFILGAKWYLIGFAGSATPFWDQWDAVADRLVTPYLNGRLRFLDLFAAHNEHHIFFERVLALGLIEVAGNWNVILEMAVNALFHIAFLAGFIWTIRRCGPMRWTGLVALVLLALFAIPSDMSNTLGGFQGQFYFLLIFALAALILFVEGGAFGWRWWLAMASSVCAFYSMAAGSLAILAAAIVIAAQMILGTRRRSAREIAGVALMVALAVAMIAVTPSTGSDVKANGLWSFLRAFTRAAGWPYYVPLIGPLILNAPVIALAVAVWRQRPAIGADAWRIVALAVWIGVECAAIAYSRAAAPVESRYVDIYGLLILINLGALYLLLVPMGRRSLDVAQLRPLSLPALWVGLTLGSLVFAEARMIPQQPTIDAPRVIARTRNVKAFIATRDPAVLQQPLLFIPYPQADRLTMLLSRPEVMGILPASYGAPPMLREQVRARLALKGGLNLSPELVQKLARLLGTLLMTIGATVFALGWAMRQPDLSPEEEFAR